MANILPVKRKTRKCKAKFMTFSKSNCKITDPGAPCMDSNMRDYVMTYFWNIGHSDTRSDWLDCHNLLLLLQRLLLPGGIILQGVLLLQGSMSIFACHYG
jgi:hypothetical protein